MKFIIQNELKYISEDSSFFNELSNFKAKIIRSSNLTEIDYNKYIGLIKKLKTLSPNSSKNPQLVLQLSKAKKDLEEISGHIAKVNPRNIAKGMEDKFNHASDELATYSSNFFKHIKSTVMAQL
jgi:hypothetical protein